MRKRTAVSACVAAVAVGTIGLGVVALRAEEKGGTAERVGLRHAVGLLDAIQAELLETKVCAGGEAIEVGIAWKSPGVLATVCRVPGKLQIYREAWEQKDGTLLLVETLNWRDQQTRSWIRAISDDEFKERFGRSDVRFVGHLDTSLTDEERARHASREKRKQELLQRP
ncbi:MAG: hypothetical protein PVJ57_04385 [Phycisphaerae bacterium]